jgi:hypothetical protein
MIMPMSKKDFWAMANAMSDAKRDLEIATDPGTPERDSAMHALDMASRRLATACAEQYRGGYGFDRHKFMDACGFPIMNGN